jgi:hypothetical protein
MHPSAPGGQHPFAVLGNAQFRLFFIGTTLTMLAFGMMQVVQGVVAFSLTGKNSLGARHNFPGCSSP